MKWQKLLLRHGVEQYSSKNEDKSNLVERWNNILLLDYFYYEKEMFKHFSS